MVFFNEREIIYKLDQLKMLKNEKFYIFHFKEIGLQKIKFLET